MEEDNKVTFILRDMSKFELKHYCLDNGMTMTEILNDGLRERIELIEATKKSSGASAGAVIKGTPVIDTSAGDKDEKIIPIPGLMDGKGKVHPSTEIDFDGGEVESSGNPGDKFLIDGKEVGKGVETDENGDNVKEVGKKSSKPLKSGNKVNKSDKKAEKAINGDIPPVDDKKEVPDRYFIDDGVGGLVQTKCLCGGRTYTKNFCDKCGVEREHR